MTTQTTSAILNNAIATSQDLLTQYALGGELIGDLITAFGPTYDSDAATDLIEQWQTGDYSDFPGVEILSSASINGANGAYSADTNTIYIAEEYLLANAANQSAVSDLLLEEYGHFVDASINSIDAAGDEGAIFSGLVQGESFTDSELQQLQLENDQAIITLDGEKIAIEQREASVKYLPANFHLRGDLTNLYIGDFNGDGKDDFFRQEKGKWDNDRNNTANIFFSNGNGTFSKQRLPESFALKGDLTNLYIGDFNGDGKDDFLRQEKGKWDDDDNNTANIFFSTGYGTFSKTTLPVNSHIKGDLTNLHIGDFDGDGKDDFLRQEKSYWDDDNLNTAIILFSNGNGSFRKFRLPENLDIKGDLTNLHVGDFNGDGKDDFLRQGKTDSGIGNSIFFSNGDGTFRKEDQTFLFGGLSRIPGLRSNSSSHTVNISDVGDFNGDGFDDLLVQESTRSFFAFTPPRRTTSILFSDGNGGFTTSALLSATANPFGGEATTLEGLSLSNLRSNLHIGDFNGNGVNELLRQGKISSDNTAQIFSNLGLNIVGTSGDDSIDGGAGDDNIQGGRGNDTLNSGTEGNNRLEGGDGNDLLNGNRHQDTLIGGAGNDTLNGARGYDLLLGGEGDDVLYGGHGFDTLEGGAGNDLLDTNSDDNKADLLKGDAGDDTLRGGRNKDTLLGGIGNDSLDGKRGNDILDGGIGDDTLDGGEGLDIASFQGEIGGFDITFNDNGSITVTDIDTSDGDEGTDTLTNISQLAFGGTRFAGNTQRSIVQAVAGVSEDKATTFISGGKADATNFVIDIEGKAGLTLDFNNQQLADFINTITLPDPDIELERYFANLAFDTAGGILGAIPVVGSLVAGGVAVGQTLSNYLFDQRQIEAQIDAANAAVKDFDSLNFGDIKETIRDTVVIEDFQIGVDNLILPTLKGLDGGYSIVNRNFGGKFGVMIQAVQDGKASELVFIANEYASLNDSQFETQIKNLLSSQQGASTVLSTFNQKPQLSPVSPDGSTRVNGTYAGDHLFGEQLTIPARGAGAGDYTMDGKFGDDLLKGNIGNDILHGGFIGDGGIFRDPETGERSLTDGNLTYQDDGFDTLQGGLGDDTLFGGSGNDLLDGGGFDFNSTDPLTGRAVALTNDGTDRLIGGSGNDTFIFNTLSTGIDIIEDFAVRVDKIRIIADRFGATDINQFSFDNTNGALSFNSQQFATLENFASLQNFDVNQDIQLV